MELVRKVSILAFSWCLASVAIGEVIVSHDPAADILSGWANGTIEASASGYNNGSIMNPGRHWASADDFLITDASGLPWQIDRITFVGGTDLNAAVDNYRVSIYMDDGGNPVGWDDYLWRYQESSGSLVDISVTQTLAGGTRDRWLYEISVDTSSLGLLLESNTTYYLSVEGDCTNTGDIYNGYDAYYQRFYMLSAINSGTSTQVNNNHWYTGKYDTMWNPWQEAAGDFVWAVEGHQVPEPCTLSLLTLGGIALLRKRKH